MAHAQDPAPLRPIDIELHRALSARRHAAASELIAAGADPTRPASIGLTPLMVASMTLDVEGCRLLIHAGCPLEATFADSHGQTALAMAARFGCADTLRILIGAGADPNPRDDCGRTPCHLAAIHGHVECLSLLLSAGSDPALPDDNGDDALALATAHAQGMCAAMILAGIERGALSAPSATELPGKPARRV